MIAHTPRSNWTLENCGAKAIAGGRNAPGVIVGELRCKSSRKLILAHEADGTPVREGDRG